MNTAYNRVQVFMNQIKHLYYYRLLLESLLVRLKRKKVVIKLLSTCLDIKSYAIKIMLILIGNVSFFKVWRLFN